MSIFYTLYGKFVHPSFHGNSRDLRGIPSRSVEIVNNAGDPGQMSRVTPQGLDPGLPSWVPIAGPKREGRRGGMFHAVIPTDAT